MNRGPCASGGARRCRERGAGRPIPMSALAGRRRMCSGRLLRRLIPYRGDRVIARSRRELAAPAVLRRWWALPSVTPGWSGGAGVERPQGVEGALGDLAGDGEGGGVGAGVAVVAA